MAVPPWNTRVQVAAALSDAVRSNQSREAATYHRGLYVCDWRLSLFRVRPGPLLPLKGHSHPAISRGCGPGSCRGMARPRYTAQRALAREGLANPVPARFSVKKVLTMPPVSRITAKLTVKL